MRRSLILVPMLMLSAGPSAAARPLDDSHARCFKVTVPPDKAVFKRLGELPTAEAFRAVLRSDACPARPIEARDVLGIVPKPRR